MAKPLLGPCHKGRSPAQALPPPPAPQPAGISVISRSSMGSGLDEKYTYKKREGKSQRLGTIPRHLTLQRALGSAEAGCSPARCNAVCFPHRSVPDFPDWFLQEPHSPASEGTGEAGRHFYTAPLLLCFTVEINLGKKGII